MKDLLIVEDEGPLRDELINLFESRGWRVAAAGDLRSAAAILDRGDSIWNVLSDVRLPDGSGLELLRYRGAAGGPDGSVRAIAFMTGHTELTDQVARSLASTGLSLLKKPVSVRTLLGLFP